MMDIRKRRGWIGGAAVVALPGLAGAAPVRAQRPAFQPVTDQMLESKVKHRRHEFALDDVLLDLNAPHHGKQPRQKVDCLLPHLSGASGPSRMTSLSHN